MAKWPTGIDAHGNGIRIRLWKHGKLVYTETVSGDPYKKGDLAAAVKRRAELKSRLDLGLGLRREEETSARLFSDVAQHYLTSFDGADSTSLDYENILNLHWIPEFGNWLIGDITIHDIKSHLAKVKHLKQKSRKNIMVPLRGVFAYAMGAGWVQFNAAAAIKVRRKQKPEVLRFKPDERVAVLEKLNGQPLLYFTLLFACGLRPSGEPLGLRWEDWDGEQLSIRRQVVRRKNKESTKTYYSRKVYVPLWVRPLLNSAPSREFGGPIFLNTEGLAYKDADVFNKAWRAALTAAKLPYRNAYCCRHTRAAELLSTGVEPADAAKQLGHTVEMFYRTYSEWIEEYARRRDLSRFEGLTVHRPSTAWGSKIKCLKDKKNNGDPDGTRTRDLRRDRPAF